MQKWEYLLESVLRHLESCMHVNKITHHVHENAKCKSKKSKRVSKKIKPADQRLRGIN